MEHITSALKTDISFFLCLQIQCLELTLLAKLSSSETSSSARLYLTLQANNRTYTTVLLTHTHTHIRLTALCPGLPRWAGTRKVKPIWILLKQETVSGSGISWAIRKSAPCSRQITTPAPHRSVFYRPDALPAAQPTASEHWRHYYSTVKHTEITHHHITNAHLKTSQAK